VRAGPDTRHTRTEKHTANNGTRSSAHKCFFRALKHSPAGHTASISDLDDILEGLSETGPFLNRDIKLSL